VADSRRFVFAVITAKIKFQTDTAQRNAPKLALFTQITASDRDGVCGTHWTDAT